MRNIGGIIFDAATVTPSGSPYVTSVALTSRPTPARHASVFAVAYVLGMGIALLDSARASRMGLLTPMGDHLLSLQRHPGAWNWLSGDLARRPAILIHWPRWKRHRAFAVPKVRRLPFGATTL